MSKQPNQGKGSGHLYEPVHRPPFTFALPRKLRMSLKLHDMRKTATLDSMLKKQLFPNVAKKEFFRRNSDIFQVISQCESEKTEATGLIGRHMSLKIDFFVEIATFALAASYHE